MQDIMDDTMDTVIMPSECTHEHAYIASTWHHGHNDITLFIFVPISMN